MTICYNPADIYLVWNPFNNIRVWECIWYVVRMFFFAVNHYAEFFTFKSTQTSTAVRGHSRRMALWTISFQPGDPLVPSPSPQALIKHSELWIITASLPTCFWQATVGEDNCPCTCCLMNIITRYFPFSLWLIVTTFLCWVPDKLPLHNDTIASLLSAQSKNGSGTSAGRPEVLDKQR